MADWGTTVPEVTGCRECDLHAAVSPHLVGACASVGIERGLSTGEMLRRYLAGFHTGGHRIGDGGGGRSGGD